MAERRTKGVRVYDDVTLIENSSDHDAVVRRILIAGTAWLRLMVWNMGNASNARVLADLIRLARYADVIMLQEAGDRAWVFRAFAITHPWWKLYRPNAHDGQAATPELRRRKWPLARAYSVPAIGKRKPHTTDGGKPKFHNVLELFAPGTRRKDRHRAPDVACINVHMVTHGAGPAAYDAQLAALCDLLEHCPAKVKATGGDLNSVPSAPRLSRLRKITTGWHSHPTHGRGDALDQVLTFEAKGSGR